jgi:hypothetical protein
MRYSGLQKIALVLAISVAGNLAFAQPTNVGGLWIVESGETPDGASYAGSTAFSTLDDRYLVSRETPAGKGEGVGVGVGDAIGAAFGATAADLVVYRVGAGGAMEGVWIDAEGNRGTERAIPAAPNGAVYTLSGNYPNNEGMYSGSLSIDERGETLELQWNVGAESSRGVGFRFGNYLVALRGSRNGFRALALYVFDSAGNADGAFAVPAADRLGSERLSKRR